MDLLPKVGGIDQYSADQRPGTGTYSRKKKREREHGQPEEGEAAGAPEMPIDPLLAELDRLRAMDPSLTESGAHRAMLALRAYQHPALPGAEALLPAPAPAPPATDAASADPGR